MPSERSIRIVHTPLFALIALTSVVSLAISASLVKYYNDHGYPGNAYRDRIRIILVGSVFSVAVSLYLLIGFLLRAGSIIFGILVHLIAVGISFLLMLIGSASLTAKTNGLDCSKAGFNRCQIVRGLVIVSWIDTIWLFLALIFVGVLGIKARSGLGARSSTLLDA